MLAFSDLRLKNFSESLVMMLVQYFPFLVKYIDLYGKENYSYLANITRVSELLRRTFLLLHLKLRPLVENGSRGVEFVYLKVFIFCVKIECKKSILF